MSSSSDSFTFYEKKEITDKTSVDQNRVSQKFGLDFVQSLIF